jgi:hypothetical protein
VINLKLKANGEWSVRLLSNPINENVNLMLTGIMGNLSIYIRDINGRTVYTGSFENINGQITLPANLQRGTYILSAETNNERKTVKFVK